MAKMTIIKLKSLLCATHAKVLAILEARNRLIREMYAGQPIHEVIPELVKLYLEENDWETADEINYGSCWDFADDLLRIYPSGVCLHNGMMEPDLDFDWDHAFFFYQGKFYDSECPNGAEDWKQLPCCIRCSK